MKLSNTKDYLANIGASELKRQRIGIVGGIFPEAWSPESCKRLYKREIVACPAPGFARLRLASELECAAFWFVVARQRKTNNLHRLAWNGTDKHPCSVHAGFRRFPINQYQSIQPSGGHLGGAPYYQISYNSPARQSMIKGLRTSIWREDRPEI